jgi:hypothetical protein
MSPKKQMLLHVWQLLQELEGEIERLVNWYHTGRYHKEMGNVTPDDGSYGQCEKILNKRAELKKTILERKKYNSKIIKTGVEIVSGVPKRKKSRLGVPS